MTQTALARACGVTQGSIAGWEKGTSFPRADKIGVVAAVLGCKVDDLLREAEHRKETA